MTVTEGTTALHIGGPKQRTVLSLLIAHADHPVSVDYIVEAVRGDDAASNARRIVQTYVATLRSELGDVIVKSGSGWLLDVEREAIDSSAFEDLFHSARDLVDTNPQRASVALREALAMWRGHPYADVEAHGSLDGEISRLSELRSAAQASRIEADLALGRHAELVGEIEALMAENPYSERLRAQSMLALYRAGRQQEALRSYQHMRELLVEELGIDPTPELQELERRILDQDESLRLTPAQTIQRRAILVADPGDPIEVGHMPAAEREELLMRTTQALRAAIDRTGEGVSITAGTTTYVVFDSVLAAAQVAESVTRRLDGEAMRFAVDWGDLVLENGRVSGPPVSRAAVLAAVAHNGQTLLSAEAQQAVGTAGGGRGLRFENLGSYELHGLEGSLLVYQLLVGDIPVVFPELETHRLPPPLPGGGDRTIPGYELREAIAPGSIGMLYRAFQPSVGREVLIEVISSADSSDFEFIRSFEAEAQRLSLLDHQNIAPVLDYWRQPDGAFLVYRYPRGGLLSQRASFDVGRLVDQIGSALAYAHSLGMIHGSVCPDRIALDEAGNASLLCFPVAAIAPKVDAESDHYVPPEIARGETAIIASDIYSLAVLAREFGSDGPVLEWATDVDPTKRPQSVVQLLGDLIPSPGGAASDRYTEARNPYKGLTAFHELDAGDFFGRSAAIEELCRALAGSNLLAIVGPSGVGKSSVARAGLVPALRSGGLPNSETWVITDMLPGSHPFLELQRALGRVSTDLPVGLTEALAAHEQHALDGVAEVLPDSADLLVLVDQFEELFTMTGEAERQAFLDLIETSIREGSVRFVLTLRADFLDRPLLYAGFGGLLKAATVMLASPTSVELTEAIARPALGVGVEVAPDLAERIVSEVRDQPGALPLVQHTLAELFTSRRSDLISIADFEDIGGVSGSVAKRAESIYSRLSEEDRVKVKQVFLRLVTIVDESSPTRRRVRVSELADLDAQEPFEAFIRSRLLVFDSDPETRTPTLEVSHEALLSHWPRLAGWIDSAREDLAMLRRLDESRLEWEASGRSDAYLLTGGRLAHHQAWTKTTVLALSQPEADYLEASRRHDERLKSRSRRRRNFIMGGFAAAAAVALVFALSASRNATDARVRALTQASLNIAADDPELAVLLAGEAVGIAQAGRVRLPPETLGALWSAYVAQKVLARFEGWGQYAVAFSPDGAQIAVDVPTAEGWTVLVSDWQSGEELGGLPSSDRDAAFEVYDISYSPDGSLISVARGGTRDGDAVVEVFSTDTFQLVSRLSAGLAEPWHLDIADDGAILVGEISDNSKRTSFALFDPRTGSELARVNVGELVGGLVPPSDGSLMPGSHSVVVGVLSEAGNHIAVIDLDRGVVSRTTAIATEPSRTALSPDGKWLAVSDFRAGTVDILDTSSWERVVPSVAHQDPQSLEWSGDSRRLGVSGNEADITVVELSEGLQVLSGHLASVYAVAFHPSRELLVSASVDGEVRIWDISSSGSAAGSIHVGSFDISEIATADSALVVSLAGEGSRVIDSETGRVIAAAPNWLFFPPSRGVASQAQVFATMDDEGNSAILDFAGTVLDRFPTCSAPRALSPDGRIVVLDSVHDDGFGCDTTGLTAVLDIGSQSILADFGSAQINTAEVTSATGFDGQVYVAVNLATDNSPSVVEIWSLEPAEKLAVIDQAMVGGLFHLALDAAPSGRYLGIGTNGPRAVVVDLEALAGGASIEDAMVFNKEAHTSNTPQVHVTDAGLVASGGFDGFYRWWDLETGDLVFEIEVEGLRGSAAHDFSSDGRYHFYEDGGGVIRRIPTDIDEMVDQALGSVTRGFTVDECRRYLEGSDCD